MIGSIHIMEVIKNLKNVHVMITSDKCYKLEKKSGYEENDILGGDDPIVHLKQRQK